jgi:hypothetical protein
MDRLNACGRAEAGHDHAAGPSHLVSSVIVGRDRRPWLGADAHASVRTRRHPTDPAIMERLGEIRVDTETGEVI